MSDLIAFYGTLRDGAGDPDAPDRTGLVERVGICRIPGLMFDLGPYPGLVPDHNGAATIAGDLFRIVHADALPVFDDWEDYDPERPDDSLYLRQWMRLAEPDVEAWVYVWNRPVVKARLIASGDWLNREPS